MKANVEAARLEKVMQKDVIHNLQTELATLQNALDSAPDGTSQDDLDAAQGEIDAKNSEIQSAQAYLEELEEEYNMAFALFDEVNAERKAIEDEARAREIENQRNEIYEGVKSDTTWFVSVRDGIAPRVEHFNHKADQWVQLGWATLTSDREIMMNAFSRFEPDASTMDDKMHYLG